MIDSNAIKDMPMSFAMCVEQRCRSTVCSSIADLHHCFVFAYAYAKTRFSDNAAQIMLVSGLQYKAHTLKSTGK